jgi:hypothetical protein
MAKDDFCEAAMAIGYNPGTKEFTWTNPCGGPAEYVRAGHTYCEHCFWTIFGAREAEQGRTDWSEDKIAKQEKRQWQT